MIKSNQKVQQKPPLEVVNAALLNMVTPFGGIEFGRVISYIGENAVKIYAIISYPESVEIGWLAKFANIPQVVSVQCFIPCDNADLIGHLSRSITQNIGIAESTKEPIKRQRSLQAAEDAGKLMKQIDHNGETVGYMCNLIMAAGKDREELAAVCRKVESAASVLRVKIRAFPCVQKEAFKTVAPFYGIEPEIESMTRYNVPLSTFIGGMPFVSPGFSDGKGFYFARDSQGGLITFDIWTRGGDRTNSNMTILGGSGKGKSTALKSIVLSEHARGTKIICIDPESEFAEMCVKLGGDRIDLAGGSSGKINPLEIRPLPSIGGDGENDIGMGAMALHFKTFEVFIKLYAPELSEIQKAILKETLEELYAKYNIYWNTDVSSMKHEDFPTFADLHTVLKDKIVKSEKKHDLEYLSVIIRELAYGSDSFLWNGHPTVNPKSIFICLDTHALKDCSSSIKAAQYYNALGWAWEQMSRDRDEKVLLVADEAHLLADPNTPQSLMFLRNVAKRARKYMAGLIVVSQSIQDFLNDAVKIYTQAVVDLSTYKIFMGCNGLELQIVTDTYKLREAEQERLQSEIRGQGVMFAGNKRLFIDVHAPGVAV